MAYAQQPPHNPTTKRSKSAGLHAHSKRASPGHDGASGQRHIAGQMMVAYSAHDAGGELPAAITSESAVHRALPPCSGPSSGRSFFHRRRDEGET
jgi:hypothetical protein